MVDFGGSGQKTRKSIYSTLNAYEFLAVGVHQNIFDEEIIRVLFKGTFEKTFKLFKSYIKHVNDDMYSERHGRIWVNFKKLAEKFISEGEPEADKRNAAG